MATYRTPEGRILPFAKPPRPDTLTPAAESARQAVRDLPPQRVVRDNGDVKVTRKPLTRAEVVAAYVHPLPRVFAHVEPPNDIHLVTSAISAGPYAFIRSATKVVSAANVKVTAARGTTWPPKKWGNPDGPVIAADYHGDVVESVVVWARSTEHGREIRVRAEWHDGRVHTVEVNGEKSSLKAALATLRGEA